MRILSYNANLIRRMIFMAKIYLVRALGGYLSISSRFGMGVSIESRLQSESGGICGIALSRLNNCSFDDESDAREFATDHLASNCEYEIVEACSYTGDIEPTRWMSANNEDEEVEVSDIADTWTSDLTGQVWLDECGQVEFKPNYGLRRRLATGQRKAIAHESELNDDSNYFQCPDCSEWMPTDDSRTDPDGDSICDSCYCSAGYFCCDRCDNVFRESDYGSDGCCEECTEPEEDEEENSNSSHIECYSKRIPFCPRLGSTDTFLLGMELEVAGEDCAGDCADLLGSDYILKEDGSLPTHGFEIVSQALGLSEHKKAIALFLADIPDGLRSFKHEECGLHVHIGRKELGTTEEQRIKTSRRIASFVCRKANREFIVKLGQRNLNHYCDADGSLGRDAYSKGIKCESNRYSAVNLCNAKTVELRFFKGNLKPDAIFRALEFADAIASWCSRSDLTFSESQDAKLFADYVIGREDGRWDNLAGMIASYFSKMATVEAGE